MAEYEGTEDLRDHEDGWTTLCGVDVIKWKTVPLDSTSALLQTPAIYFALLIL